MRARSRWRRPEVRRRVPRCRRLGSLPGVPSEERRCRTRQQQRTSWAPARRRSRTWWAWPPSAMESGRRPASSATASGATCPSGSSRRRSRRSPAGSSTSGWRPATASRCCARRASSGRTRTSRSPPRAGSSSRSTRRTPPRSARGWRATPSRASSICEDEGQVAKIAATRDQLPALQEVIAIEPVEGALSLDALRERGRPRDAAGARRARGGGQARGPVHDHLHVRHDRAAQGLRAHARQLPPGHADVRGDRHHRGRRGRLPLPSARARLRAADPAAGGRPRRPARLLERRPAADRARPDGDPAGLSPVGPAHLREDLHARHVEQRPGEDHGRDGARAQGAPDARGGPSRSREPLQAAFDKADAELFVNVRNIFGGNLKQATSGAAPIAKEILEFFYACGAPVLEGYGMTETSTVTTASTVADHRLGTVGHALPGSRDQDRRRRRDPRPRPAHLPRLLRHRATRRRSARSRTAGCTPATSGRSTRTATCRSPAARRTS